MATPRKPRPAPPEAAAPPASDYLTRDEALSRLGIKRSTLYTYVSRGWIKSVPSDASRSHLFSREDVERIRGRGLAHAGDIAPSETAMRWGPPVIPTRITQITPEGPRYRGRGVLELARAGYSFEAVAQLLWSGTWEDGKLAWDLPARTPREPLPESMAIQKRFAAAVLALAGTRREVEGGETLRIAQEIIACMVQECDALAAKPARKGAPPSASIALRLALALGVKPAPGTLYALNAALVLCADHELSPSVLVARVTASSGADLYACVAAAVCAHSGAQTGRGCDKIEELIGERASRASLRGHLQTVRNYGAQLFGFNHPLYPRGDPRAWLLLELAGNAAQSRHPARSPARDLLWFLHEAAETHHTYPGIAVGLVALARALELPRGSATAIWTLGRTAGLVAHVLEQRLEGYLMRPRARFVG